MRLQHTILSRNSSLSKVTVQLHEEGLWVLNRHYDCPKEEGEWTQLKNGQIPSKVNAHSGSILRNWNSINTHLTQLVVHNYHWISLHSVLGRSSLVWQVTLHFSPPYIDHWLLTCAWSPATKRLLWMPRCSSKVIQNIFILFFVSILPLEMVLASIILVLS